MIPTDIPKTTFKKHHGHYKFTVMLFELTKALATFQALMNHIFEPYLRKFMLVFFDDILIYSPSFTQHLKHLRIAFQVLRLNRLCIKKSKCAFAQTQVEYLGHVISSARVSTDPKKISDMLSWPKIGNVRSLRGFLGLTDYYKHFVRNYGVISKPLSNLLKRDSFKWAEKAKAAFRGLK